VCLSTQLQIIGHALRGFAVYSNNAQWPVYTLRYYASPDRNEQGTNRINVHHEAKRFEDTPNTKLFPFGRNIFTENWKVWCNGVGAARCQNTGVKYMYLLNCVTETPQTSLCN